MFPFHYSSLNYDLVQSTPSGSLNILWNQLNQKSIANSMMYMTPTFNFSIGYEYPEFGMFGNNLLNPLLAMQQTMQAFQNGNWMNGMNGMNNWGNWQMPWNTPWGTTPSGSSTSNSEYDALKALITKYKEIGTKNSSLSPSLLDKINNALNKSGKPEEKLEALRDLYKQLDKNKLEKALLELPEYKKMLDVAGYKFNGTNKEEDTKLKKELNSLEQDIKNKKGDNLVTVSVSENNPSILRIISYWNDTHKDDSSRGIIRLVANNLPSEESEMELHKKGINNLAMSLINKVEDFKSEVDGDFSKLDEAKDNVSKALTTANEKFTKDNLLALAKEFDTLYAMLRMMEAERVRNTINTKYGFLNDISSTDKDIADDNLIVEDTKADLKNEGIKVDDIEIDTVPEEDVEEVSDIDERVDTADEKVEELVKEEELKKTARDGVYTTTQSSTNEPAKFYTVKEDKLVELKGVKSIDKDGNCTMADGSKKAQKDVETVEVTAQDVIDYNNALERVDSLVKDGTIKKCSTKLNGSTLYKSKGIQENGHSQYFIVKDNQLMRVVCDYVDKNGNVVINGETKAAKDLTTDNFETISNSDIVTTDKKKEAEERKAQEEKDKKEAEEKEEREVFEKTYEPPKMQQADVDKAKEIAELLMGNTDDDEWGEASTLIMSIKKENVHTIISKYADEEGAGTDNILEQIATEQECKGLFGTEWGCSKRDAGERLKLINHIIKCVLEHCETYGVKNEYAYTKLKEAYNNGKGITEDMINNKAESEIRKLDGYILKLVETDIEVSEEE